MLAKQLATLQFLSNNRVILGAGVGWYAPEFEAVGVYKSERGRRTDEIMDIMLPLLRGERLSYDGEFYRVTDVYVEPPAPRPPEIWIGGGSQLADSSSPELARLVEPVKARVLRSDGWIARPTCPPGDIARDWDELQQYLSDHGRDPSTYVVAHENFLHLVRTDDSRDARAAQHAAFMRVMSAERGPDYLESVYLFGTPDEIVASLQARIDAGVQYFMLHTMTPDPAQLYEWTARILPNLRFPQAAQTALARAAL